MGFYEFKLQDAYDFARAHGEYRERGKEIELLKCPYCHGGKSDKWTFAINKDSGQFKCFRSSCMASGNMITLAKDFGFSLGKDIDEYYTHKTEYRKLSQPKEKIIPKQNAIDYLVKRGISKEIVEKYEITCQNKDDKILVFPFFDEVGKLQFVKYRNTEYVKGETKGSKEWCESNCKPILYGMKQCNGSFDRVIITEGQIDSLSLSECGIENAVSVPTGAMGFTWIPHVWDWFSKFKEIIVFGDYEKGKITLLDELSKRFRDKIKHIRFEDYQGCKDANEILMKYGKQVVVSAVENAVHIPINRVVELADIEKVDIYSLPKLATGISELDKLLKGGLYFGQLDIIGGKRGEGKSTFAGQILVNAIEQNYNVFAYSGELPNYLFKAWIDMQVAGNSVIETTNKFGEQTYFVTNSDTEKINDWYRGKFLVYDNTMVSDENENLLKTVESVIVQFGTQVVLIDNLMTAIDLDCEVESNKWEKQSKFVKKLTRIALQYNVIILLVAHRRKSQGTLDINDEISGSGDITNLAGVVVSYDRNEDAAIQAERLLKLTKSRLIGKLDFNGIPLSYDERTKRIFGESDDLYKDFSWKKTDGFRQVTNAEQLEIEENIFN